jgi:hypothetical protein
MKAVEVLPKLPDSIKTLNPLNNNVNSSKQQCDVALYTSIN